MLVLSDLAVTAALFHGFTLAILLIIGLPLLIIVLIMWYVRRM